jgi:hypothetical protein
MLADFAINLKLKTLADVCGSRLEINVKKNAAVAVAFALEPQGKLEVLVAFFGLQVAVILGPCQTVDGSVLHIPRLISDFDPASQVLAIEQIYPVFAGKYRLLRLSEQNCTKEKNSG